MSTSPFARLWLAVAIGLLPAIALSEKDAGPPVPANVKFIPDVEYRKNGEVRRMLDLARPNRPRGPHPAVIVLHGAGTFIKGRKGLTRTILKLAGEGYVAVAVSYNHDPAGNFLDPIHDVKAAVRWLRIHANTYRIDPERIGVVGYSAGSCLACLLALTTPRDGLEGVVPPNAPSSQVQAVVGYFGPTDFLSLYSDWKKERLSILDPEIARRPFLIRNVENWFGGTPTDAMIKQRYEKLSPLRYVRKDPPPLLLQHGKLDRVIPPAQSEQLHEKLKELKASVALKLYATAGHDFDEDEAKHATDAAEETRQFLKLHLRPGKK
jgi:acetyl esterase/lipase